jgi:addiction module HigA family antidote
MIFNPAHPGEVLRDNLEGLSVGDAASRLGITRAHLSRVLNGHAGITANMSLRLAAALGTSPEFWLKMQMNYDLWLAQKQTSRFKVLPFRRPAAGKVSQAETPARRTSHTQGAEPRRKDRGQVAIASK